LRRAGRINGMPAQRSRDSAWPSASGASGASGASSTRCRPKQRHAGAGHQPLFESYVHSTGLAFLDAYLKGLREARAWLESQALQTVSANVATLSRR
jgi:hypothetical protein